MSEQKPTVGRIVHYYDGEEVGPQAAIITQVHSDDCVNLQVFCNDSRGTSLVTSAVKRTSPEESSFCWDWPPRA